MMLETLSGLDRPSAARALARAALATSPKPGVDDVLERETDDPDVAKLVHEIRVRLRLKDDDKSDKAQASIDRYLADAISNSVDRPRRLEALARAGDAGRLSPSAYVVRQPKSFERQFRSLGATKRLVEQTVLHPAEHEHQMADPKAIDQNVFSLFLRSFHERDGLAPHWFMVQTLRRGVEQIAQAAWFVFPDVIDLQNATRPVDVLRAFAEKFGFDVEVGTQRGRLVLSEPILHADGMPIVKYAFEAPSHRHTFSTWSIQKLTEEFQVNVGLAYTIDLREYGRYLKDHHII